MEYFLIVVVVLLSVQFSVGLPYRNDHHLLESPKLSGWGDWGKVEHCPSDQVVIGMRLKVHNNQGGVKDDSALNGVKFYCQNLYSSEEYAREFVEITSLVGNEGEWKQNYFCPGQLVAVGFQLRSEKSSGVKDDTAGNNLRLICSDLWQKKGYSSLEGDGTKRGHWTRRQLCWPGYVICGLQTQVEVSRSIDTTGLNNLKVRCCMVDSSGGDGDVEEETGSRNGTIIINGSVENFGEDGGVPDGVSREGLAGDDDDDEQELVGGIVDPEPVAEEVAGEDDGKLSTATVINILERVVNALENGGSSGDSVSGRGGGGEGGSTFGHGHPNGHGDTRPFHWGTEMTNLTNILEKDQVMDNSLESEKEPKYSPRFAQNGTITVDMSMSTSKAVRFQQLNPNALGVGFMVMIIYAKVI